MRQFEADIKAAIIKAEAAGYTLDVGHWIFRNTCCALGALIMTYPGWRDEYSTVGPKLLVSKLLDVSEPEIEAFTAGFDNKGVDDCDERYLDTYKFGQEMRTFALHG